MIGQMVSKPLSRTRINPFSRLILPLNQYQHNHLTNPSKNVHFEMNQRPKVPGKTRSANFQAKKSKEYLGLKWRSSLKHQVELHWKQCIPSLLMIPLTGKECEALVRELYPLMDMDLRLLCEFLIKLIKHSPPFCLQITFGGG